MLKTRHYLFLLFCVGLFYTSKATHNRAGEITYKWLYGYTYQIKITTYTSIGGVLNVADRCEDTLYFGDGTSAVVLRSNGPIGGCAPAHEGVPINSYIKLNEYVTTHTYAGAGNYKMSMEDPNRTSGVINIPNSVNQVFYIESLLVIPAFGSGKNDSPILTYLPLDDGCVGKCFEHNPGAYDLDGDSLSYELTNSRGHQGVTCPGYTYPPTGGGTYNINTTTGTLTWCTPQLQGEYDLSIIIKEWRLYNGNYILIGYVLRDMLIAVGVCNNNQPNIYQIVDTCILARKSITNTITATDPDYSVLTMQATGAPFSVASSTATFSSPPNYSPVYGVFHWQTNYTHIRRMPYQVTLKVKDSDPTVSLVDFKTFNVKVIPHSPINLTTIITNNFILLNWSKPLFYSLSGTNTFLRYKVYRKTGLSNWAHSSCETAPPSYTGFAYLGVTNPSIADTTFMDYNSGSPFIIGQDYSYVVLAEYSDGSTSYVSNISSGQYFVGINELSMKTSDITIFPNPVNENFTINFTQTNNELITIDLQDVCGRKLKTFLNNEALQKQATFNFKLDNFIPGIYFLKITGNHNTAVTKKIIKQ